MIHCIVVQVLHLMMKQVVIKNQIQYFDALHCSSSVVFQIALIHHETLHCLHITHDIDIFNQVLTHYENGIVQHALKRSLFT